MAPGLGSGTSGMVSRRTSGAASGLGMKRRGLGLPPAVRSAGRGGCGQNPPTDQPPIRDSAPVCPRRRTFRPRLPSQPPGPVDTRRRYRAPDADAFAALMQRRSLAGYLVEPMPPIEVRDRYLDTEEAALLRAALLLRLRDHDGTVTASLRVAEGESGEEHAHARFPEPPADHEGVPELPEGAFREAVEAHTGGRTLDVLLHLHQFRAPRALYDGDRLAGVLSLDVVSDETGGEAGAVSNEVEVELVQGGLPADLRRLDAQLQHLGFAADPFNKFERGLLRRGLSDDARLYLLPRERAALEGLRASDSAVERRRAETILLAADGEGTREISRLVGLSPSRVRHWRAAFRQERLLVFDADADGPAHQDDTEGPLLPFQVTEVLSAVAFEPDEEPAVPSPQEGDTAEPADPLAEGEWFDLGGIVAGPESPEAGLPAPDAAAPEAPLAADSDEGAPEPDATSEAEDSPPDGPPPQEATQEPRTAGEAVPPAGEEHAPEESEEEPEFAVGEHPVALVAAAALDERAAALAAAARALGPDASRTTVLDAHTAASGLAESLSLFREHLPADPTEDLLRALAEVGDLLARASERFAAEAALPSGDALPVAMARAVWAVERRRFLEGLSAEASPAELADRAEALANQLASETESEATPPFRHVLGPFVWERFARARAAGDAFVGGAAEAGVLSEALRDLEHVLAYVPGERGHIARRLMVRTGEALSRVLRAHAIADHAGWIAEDWLRPAGADPEPLHELRRQALHEAEQATHAFAAVWAEATGRSTRDLIGRAAAAL